ncbi:MAG: SDR family oxidoreductase [Bacteroidota bacterium]
MKRIAILGCGWLGFPLAKALLAQGWTVNGSTRSTQKIAELQAAGIDAYQIDFDQPETLDQLTGFLQMDEVFINLPPGRRRPDVLDWYPKIAQRITESLNPRLVKRLTWVSSTGVYGTLEGQVDESMTPLPQTDSQKALFAAEQKVQQGQHPWLILRPAGLVGGNRNPGRWLAGKTGLKNGTDVVNLIHREDLIELIIQLLNSQVENSVFNVCADEHPLKGEYYPKMALQMGLEPPVYDWSYQSLEKEGNSVQYTGKWIDNQKIKKALKYTFKYPDPYDFP